MSTRSLAISGTMIMFIHLINHTVAVLLSIWDSSELPRFQLIRSGMFIQQVQVEIRYSYRCDIINNAFIFAFLYLLGRRSRVVLII